MDVSVGDFEFGFYSATVYALIVIVGIGAIGYIVGTGSPPEQYSAPESNLSEEKLDRMAEPNNPYYLNITFGEDTFPWVAPDIDDTFRLWADGELLAKKELSSTKSETSFLVYIDGSEDVKGKEISWQYLGYGNYSAGNWSEFSSGEKTYTKPDRAWNYYMTVEDRYIFDPTE